MNSRVLMAIALAVLASPALWQEQGARSANWENSPCQPVDREADFGFTREPTVKKVDPDRYEIFFAVKAKCDVAVAVEGADGRIVRHVAYGVLGSNAPAPFEKNALEQTLYWNGKDEFGKYVQTPEKCRVRVSLGLNPTFDKIIGWHPKDVAQTRTIAALAADPDGVYVLECLPGGNNQLRKYSHDGGYVETLYPWNPDKLDKIHTPKRTLPDAQIWQDTPPGGKQAVPVLVGYGATAPFNVVQGSTCVAVAAGKLAFYTKGGHGDVRRLLRLRTDGTTGGEPIEGPTFTNVKSSHQTVSSAGWGHMALSPDGKWVYVSGMGRSAGFGKHRDMRYETPPFGWNAVFRFAWDEKGPVVEGRDSFVGEVSRDPKAAGAGDDKDHFDTPLGLACDTAGRLYVADTGNHRVQVFSPDGKLVKSIPVQQPVEIAVHPKTGAIYLLCYKPEVYGGHQVGIIPRKPLALVKLGPLDNPVERMRMDIPVAGDPYTEAFTPLMTLDGWAQEPRVWLVHEWGVVRIYAERDDKFQLTDDFREDVRRAGHTAHAMTGNHMGYLAVDPVRGHLYRRQRNLVRIDPEEGKTWQTIDTFPLPRSGFGGMEEVLFGWDGLLYVRHLKYVARFNPDKFKQPIALNADCELPFDYGEEMHGLDRKGGEAPATLRGVIAIPWAMGGANGYNNGMGVSPRGDVLALVENFQKGEVFTKGNTTQGDRILSELKNEEERYRPAQFAGRPWTHGHLVWRWTRTGQPTAPDAIPGLPYSSFGIRTDAAGNIYCGVGYHMNVGGKEHIGGSLAKFAPKGGKLIRDFDTPVKLDNPPQRPADFLSGGGKIWGQNMFWCAPGMDQIHFVDSTGTGYPCECYHCKFDTDLYGRSFLPRAYSYHVAVLDTNGNRICTIGRYGNADKPAMKPGDTDIGLGQCSYLATVSDRWLYIADDANLRIIRMKLGYQTEKSVMLGP